MLTQLHIYVALRLLNRSFLNLNDIFKQMSVYLTKHWSDAMWKVKINFHFDDISHYPCNIENNQCILDRSLQNFKYIFLRVMVVLVNKWEWSVTGERLKFIFIPMTAIHSYDQISSYSMNSFNNYVIKVGLTFHLMSVFSRSEKTLIRWKVKISYDSVCQLMPFSRKDFPIDWCLCQSDLT